MTVTNRKRPRIKGKPASKDVLGNTQPYEQLAEKVKPKWRKHLGRLLDLREELLKEKRAQLHDAVEEAPSFSMHMADAATDSYDRDLALELSGHPVLPFAQMPLHTKGPLWGITEFSAARPAAAPLSNLKRLVDEITAWPAAQGCRGAAGDVILKSRSRRDPLADNYQGVERHRTLALGVHRQRVDVDLGYFGNTLHQPADR